MAGYESMATMLGAGGFMAFIAAFFAIFLVSVIVLYIYTSIVWMTIFRKIEYKYPWIAWIPIANVAGILQAGGFHWAWIFLILVPVLGWIAIFVLAIIATWRIYEKRKYPGWLALIPIAGIIPFINWIAAIGNLVVLGLVAWADR